MKKIFAIFMSFVLVFLSFPLKAYADDQPGSFVPEDIILDQAPGMSFAVIYDSANSYYQVVVERPAIYDLWLDNADDSAQIVFGPMKQITLKNYGYNPVDLSDDEETLISFLQYDSLFTNVIYSTHALYSHDYDLEHALSSNFPVKPYDSNDDFYAPKEIIDSMDPADQFVLLFGDNGYQTLSISTRTGTFSCSSAGSVFFSMFDDYYNDVEFMLKTYNLQGAFIDSVPCMGQAWADGTAEIIYSSSDLYHYGEISYSASTNVPVKKTGSDPGSTQPGSTTPEATQPEATQPEATQPGSTSPEVTQPGIKCSECGTQIFDLPCSTCGYEGSILDALKLGFGSWRQDVYDQTIGTFWESFSAENEKLAAIIRQLQDPWMPGGDGANIMQEILWSLELASSAAQSLAMDDWENHRRLELAIENCNRAILAASSRDLDEQMILIMDEWMTKTSTYFSDLTLNLNTLMDPDFEDSFAHWLGSKFDESNDLFNPTIDGSYASWLGSQFHEFKNIYDHEQEGSFAHWLGSKFDILTGGLESLGQKLDAILTAIPQEFDASNPDGFVGGIATVIGSIIEALAGLAGDILALPGTIISGLSDLLKTLFAPGESFFSSNFDEIKTLFDGKLNLPTDDLESIGNIVEPDGSGGIGNFTGQINGQDVTFVDVSMWQQYMPIIQKAMRGFFYPLLLLANINYVYFLVRGKKLFARGDD